VEKFGRRFDDFVYRLRYYAVVPKKLRFRVLVREIWWRLTGMHLAGHFTSNSESPKRQKKKKLLVSVHPTDLNFNPRPYKIVFIFPKNIKKCKHGKEIKTFLSYQNTMMVTDIFHDINCDLLVDKTSIVTARGSTVVSVLVLSKNKISK
jgi:hypothetical protein